MRNLLRPSGVAALPLLTMAACMIDAPTFVNFDGGIDADPNAIDADPNAIDADPNAPDAGPPTFTRIVHVAADRVYAADVTNGNLATPVLLSGAFTNPTATIRELQASADGNVIMYIVDATIEAEYEVYLVRHGVDGFSEPQLISVDHGTSFILNHVIKPDGTGVVYTYGTDPDGFRFVDQRYYVDLTSQTPGTPTALGDRGGFFAGQFSPDSSKFLFKAVPPGASAEAAYMVDMGGAVPSAPVLISPAPVSQRGVVGEISISPDSSKVVFSGDHITADKWELYFVDLSAATPGAPVKISGTLQNQGDVTLYSFSSDSAKVAYVADDSVEEVHQLFVVNVDGASPGPAQRVNGPYIGGGNLASTSDLFGGPYAFARGSSALAYLADERTNDTIELFIVDVAGASPGASQPLNGALVAGGGVAQLLPSPDGMGLAYTADQRTDDEFELFYVDLRSAVPSVGQVVNADLVAGTDVTTVAGRSFAFSGDGSRIAYVIGEGAVQRQQLHRASIVDGSPIATQSLHSVTNINSYVWPFAFSGDGRTVAFRANPVSTTPDIWAVDVSSVVSDAAERVNIADPSGAFQLRP